MRLLNKDVWFNGFEMILSWEWSFLSDHVFCPLLKTVKLTECGLVKKVKQGPGWEVMQTCWLIGAMDVKKNLFGPLRIVAKR